jgi:D-sedoheptulose 7-phosphate isomerase
MDLIKPITDSIELKRKLLQQDDLYGMLHDSIQIMVDCYKQGGKVLLCGNGGSAADAQHLAAELSGRFYMDRPPLFAEALHVNTSFLTAVANDFSFNHVYERMVLAAGRENDVLMAFSTSGHSPNILLALDAARRTGMKTIGFSGESGGDMPDKCDVLFRVPSTDTPRIQEIHILLGHIICEQVEKQLFGHDS